MQAFIIEAANKPGELARLAAPIAERDVNVYPISLGLGSRGGFAVLSNDEADLKNALIGAGVEYREIPVLTISLDDRPGTAAAVARKLGDASVNIELFAPVHITDGKVTIVIGVDKIADARRILSDQLIDWKMPEPAHAGMASRL